MDWRRFLSLAGVAGIALPDTSALRAADAPSVIAIDYAYYNPVSLLLKRNGWLEADGAKDGVSVVGSSASDPIRRWSFCVGRD
jgi:hypothetical protein